MLDEVLQLAHISGPCQAHQGFHRISWDLIDGAIHFLRVLLGEVSGQERYVLRMIAQRRVTIGNIFNR